MAKVSRHERLGMAGDGDLQKGSIVFVRQRHRHGRCRHPLAGGLKVFKQRIDNVRGKSKFSPGKHLPILVQDTAIVEGGEQLLCKQIEDAS